MNIAEYCLGKPGAVETYPFGSQVTVFKAHGKMFALAPATDEPSTLSLKCDPTRAILLRQDFPEITAGYHLNKVHWNTLSLAGNLTDDLIHELIDHSYSLVVGTAQ